MDCRVYGGLVLGVQWTVDNKEDRYLICAGLQSIGRRYTGSEMVCRVYGGLELCKTGSSLQ